MNANQRQGAVAEIRVALSLVEHGCAVNSLTQMDFGTDLNVQVPRRVPDVTDQVWEMTQQTANLQIKSSRNAAGSAAISYAVVAEWSNFRRATSPTFVVLTVRDSYFVFDTARIRRLAERSIRRAQKKLNWDDEYGAFPMPDDLTVTFSAKNGLSVSPDLLSKLIVYWTLNASELDLLSRWGVDLWKGVGIENVDASLDFIGKAVAGFAVKFFDYEKYKHSSSGGAQDTYDLANEMLEEVFGAARSSSGGTATRIVSSIPITPSGWGATPALDLLVNASSIDTARTELIDLARSLRSAPGA